MSKFNNISFRSRCKTIREADNIARYVNELFPRISGTKIEPLMQGNTRCYTPIYYSKIRVVRKQSEEIYFSQKPNFQKCSNMIDLIRNKKVGNCGESAFLTRIVAKCNSIKNAKIAYLCYIDKYSDLDHCVVYVDDKKPYIKDSWLGFADYIPETIEKYRGVYRKLSNLDNKILQDKGLNFFSESKGNCITHDQMRFSDALMNNPA